jgi:hypothetical protein
MKKAIWAGLTSVLISTSAMAANTNSCAGLPNSAALKAALTSAVSSAHGVKDATKLGFLLDMWATVVGRDGMVCAVAYSGSDATGGQWLGSRVISAQKSNTGNAFSLGNKNGPAAVAGRPGFAIATANLYSPTQPGGSLFGLQHSNPVWAPGAYGDKINSGGLFTGVNTANYGTAADPMIGQVIGGVNVFGGGLGLYDTGHNRIGGVGVSGDTSCMDHIVAWWLRNALKLDNLATVNGFANFYGGDTADHPDNIIFDIAYNAGSPVGISPSGYGHPVCTGAAGPTGQLTNAQASAIVTSNTYMPSANH